MQVSKRHTNPIFGFHADSRFTESTLDKLEKSLQHKPDALHYFDLVFLDDGPALTAINTVGVWFRSHVLALPFRPGFA